MRIRSVDDSATSALAARPTLAPCGDRLQPGLGLRRRAESEDLMAGQRRIGEPLLVLAPTAPVRGEHPPDQGVSSDLLPPRLAVARAPQVLAAARPTSRPS